MCVSLLMHRLHVYNMHRARFVIELCRGEARGDASLLGHQSSVVYSEFGKIKFVSAVRDIFRRNVFYISSIIF